MRYLLVSHVPFAPGLEPGTLRSGDMWLADLTAQANAAAAAGFRLTVACPLDTSAVFSATGSFNTVNFRPADHGFDHVPLPRFRSAGQYLKARRQLKQTLDAAVRDADLVQMDYGGHPISYGEATWPIVRKYHRNAVWVFDGADPFPRMELEAANTRNPLKKLVKRWNVARFRRFCRMATATADLVFAHNAAVVDRFAEVWSTQPRDGLPPRCHRFDRSFVSNDLLLSDDELRARQHRLQQAGTLKLVVAGRQIAIKGTDQLIRALAKCRRLGADITLDVFGDGGDLEAFQQLAVEEGVADHVHFRGTVPFGKPLFDEWDNAHALVVTNLTAEISRNVLLACARGLLLISYTNPGTDQMLKSHDAAMLVRRGDEDELAAALLQAHRSRERGAELIANGLQLARSRTLDATHQQRMKLAAEVVGLPAPQLQEGAV